jgi:hypothetical protein
LHVKNHIYPIRRRKKIEKKMQRASVSRRSGDNSIHNSTPPSTSSSSPKSTANPRPTIRSRSSERHLEISTMDDGATGANAVNGMYDANTTNNNNNYQRSQSDPFDTATAEEDDDDDDDDVYALAESTGQISISQQQQDTVTTNSSNAIVLPTFARYPCLENKNYNCYSTPPISIFHVRSKEYMNSDGNKKKIVSQPYILQEPRGADVFLLDPKKKSSTTFSILSMYVQSIFFVV